VWLGISKEKIDAKLPHSSSGTSTTTMGPYALKAKMIRARMEFPLTLVQYQGNQSPPPVCTSMPPMSDPSKTFTNSPLDQVRSVSPNTSAPSSPIPPSSAYQPNAAVRPQLAGENTNPSPPRRRKTTSLSPKCSLGRWTREEHDQFLEGMKIHGREWKKVATGIRTRTSAQIRSHAQKYFNKLSREHEQRLNAAELAASMGGAAGPWAGRGAYLHSKSDLTAAVAAAGVLGAVPPARLSSSALDRMVQILHDPIAGGVQREVDETLAALQERHTRLQNRLGRHRQQQAARLTRLSDPRRTRAERNLTKDARRAHNN